MLQAFFRHTHSYQKAPLLCAWGFLCAVGYFRLVHPGASHIIDCSVGLDDEHLSVLDDAAGVALAHTQFVVNHALGGVANHADVGIGGVEAGGLHIG